jgi:hypothetical protein
MKATIRVYSQGHDSNNCNSLPKPYQVFSAEDGAGASSFVQTSPGSASV